MVGKGRREKGEVAGFESPTDISNKANIKTRTHFKQTTQKHNKLQTKQKALKTRQTKEIAKRALR